MTPFILASASPRRAELLQSAGYKFTVHVSPAREPAHKPANIPTDVWPAVLAAIKAQAVQQHLRTKKLIVAADTIVVCENRILNKAHNRAHAGRMLSSLFDKQHQVITGLAFLQQDRLRLARAVATCYIKRPTNAWLDAYLDSNLWRGKAGAYGIQDPSAEKLVKLIAGEWSTVVGLPMQLLASELRSFSGDS